MRCLWVWCDFWPPVLLCLGLCSCVAGEFAWCIAVELVGPWVVLGFSVDMEVFDELLLINVPWIQEFSGVLEFWI